MLLKLIKSLLLLTIAIMGFVRAVYDVRFERFTKIEADTETLMEFNIRLVGRHRLMNGTIVSHVDFDDTYELDGKVEAFVNGEWKPLAMNGRFKVCAFMKSIYEKYYESSFINSTMPKGKDKCPFKKGEYTMNNVEFKTENWPPFAIRGLNRFELVITKNNTMYGGFLATATLTDRNI